MVDIAMKTIFDDAVGDYFREKKCDYHIIDLHVLDNLSCVRNQGKTKTCMLVAMATCVEMLYRKLCVYGGEGFHLHIDIQEAFENIDKIYEDKIAAGDRLGVGTSLFHFLRYACKKGLVLTTEFRSPVPRDLLAEFSAMAWRIHIPAYSHLDADEAFCVVGHYPVVVCLRVYPSFSVGNEIIYEGPGSLEVEEGLPILHAMVAVGTTSIQRDGHIHRYLILQGSNGKRFRFHGFVLVPFDLPYAFCLPVLTDRQHKKIKKIKPVEFFKFKSPDDSNSDWKASFQVHPEDKLNEKELLLSQRVGFIQNLSTTLLVDWPEGGYLITDSPKPRGEIVVGGPNVTLGYLKNEERSKEVYKVDERGMRWFYTGGIGQFHGDGCLDVVDCKKDIVKLQHGEYVSLGKVEAAVSISPYIDNIMVRANSFHSVYVALVVASQATLEAWVSNQGIVYSNFLDLCEEETLKEVSSSVQKEAKAARLEKFEIPVKIKLLSEA
ncbi:uncharacterized protein [Henckelia pumila]|uniref:uncharacterized protein n=1 Tax=Henckelia pumila TaxID=405737 RepID=UPI003C6E2645